MSNVEIHVLELPHKMYLRHCQSKLVVHGILNHDKLSELISRMTVLLYVSLSESSGLMALDALSRGIPCIVSDTGGYLNKRDLLYDDLVVTELNSPKAITEKIRHVLENRSDIIPRIENFMLRYERRAIASVKNFQKLHDSEQDNYAKLVQENQRVAADLTEVQRRSSRDFHARYGQLNIGE